MSFIIFIVENYFVYLAPISSVELVVMLFLLEFIVEADCGIQFILVKYVPSIIHWHNDFEG